MPFIIHTLYQPGMSEAGCDALITHNINALGVFRRVLGTTTMASSKTANQLVLGIRRLSFCDIFSRGRHQYHQQTRGVIPPQKRCTSKAFTSIRESSTVPYHFSTPFCVSTHSAKLPGALLFDATTNDNCKPWSHSQARRCSSVIAPDTDDDVADQARSHSSPISTSISLSSSSSSASSISHKLDVYGAESIVYPSWDRHANIEIANVEVSHPEGDLVTVSWRRNDDVGVDLGVDVDGPRFDYPLVWLRDNCRCPSCFDATARSRTASISSLDDVKCSVQSVAINDDRKSVTIVWSDGHVSQYPARWLRCNAFCDSEHDPVRDIEPDLWDAAGCRRRMRFFDFDDLLQDEATLFDMLQEIKTLGIAVIENTPLEVGQIHRLGARVCYLVPCNYGETFQVQAKVDPSNAAYTSGDLSMHTDLSYQQRPPGIQMLHCIKQADGEGGDNTLVDGFKIAYDLRQSAPKLFDILTKELVEFYDSGTDALGDFYMQSRHKIISLDEHREVNGIVFSDHGRSALTRVSIRDSIKMYKALAAFTSLLYDPANTFEYRLKDGDILIMDNNRVFHGRKAFSMTPGTTRHLEGGYFDWDPVHSKLRVLKQILSSLTNDA